MIKKLTSCLSLALLTLHLAAGETVVTPGVWCTDLKAAKAHAVENAMPLFCFYGVDGCAYCEKAITAFNTAMFKNWMNEHKIVMLWLHPNEWSNDEWWNFASDNWRGADLFPAMRVWWPKTGSEKSGVTGYAFVGRLNHSSLKKFSGTRLEEKLITVLNTYIKGYSPEPAVSSFSFNATSATVAEGASKQFSVTRSGGTAALTVTLELDAESGAKFDNGQRKRTLEWKSGEKGERAFTVKTAYAPKLGSSVKAKVTMTVPKSTADVPTENKTPNLTVTVTDSFVDDYEWIDDIDVKSGGWWSDDDASGVILGVELSSGPAAAIELTAAKTGIVNVTLDAENTATVSMSVGSSEKAVDSDYQVGINEGEVLTITASGSGTALIKAMTFLALESAKIKSPADKASFSKDAVRADPTLVDLSWGKAKGATSYDVSVNKWSTNVPATVTSFNALAAGAISVAGQGDDTYAWSVTALCDEGLEIGGPVRSSASKASFALSVDPVFDFDFTTVSVSMKASATIPVSASGAPGLVYSASGLPKGLSINASTGVISGVPAKAGSYKVTVTVKSSNGHAVSKTLTVSVAKFPKATLGGKFVGCLRGGDGLATAGYEISISSSGRVSGYRFSSNGKSRVTGEVRIDYSTGACRQFLRLDGKDWLWSSGAFVNGTSVILRQSANNSLNGYSNVCVTDASGASHGYLTVKVTSGKKAKVVGYVDGKKVNASVTMAISGGTGNAFFGSNGVSGLLEVTKQGVESAQVCVGSVVRTARACKFATSLDPAALKGFSLTVGGESLPVVVKSSKISVDRKNDYKAKLSWTKKTGVFKGSFNGKKYQGAFVKTTDGWMGFGSTIGSFMSVTIAK